MAQGDAPGSRDLGRPPWRGRQPSFASPFNPKGLNTDTQAHRTPRRPPHPAPRTVTIAIRPSHRDETKELNPITADLSRAQLVRSAVLLAVFSDGRIGVNV